MPKPRVLIGAMAGVQGGPRTYAVSLARALVRAAPDLDLRWLSEVRAPEVEAAGLPTVRLPLAHPALRPVWDHLGVPGVLRRERPHLYHNTKNCLPVLGRRRTVVTIHDLAPFTAPETFSRAARAYLRVHTAHAARVADRVIAVSESTKADLLRILGVPEERVAVVPNGVDDSFRRAPTARFREVRERHRLPERYVLYAGTIQPRKNPRVLLEAFLGLPPALREGLALVYVGRMGWLSRDFAGWVAAARKVADVRVLERLPFADLPDVYAGAEVFASPSSYEGFGLTVAEAMAAGTPVVAGNRSSLPEVVGDAGLLVLPTSVLEVRDALAALLADDALRSDLSRRGRERAARFTWDRAAELTAGVYREVLRAPPRAAS